VLGLRKTEINKTDKNTCALQRLYPANSSQWILVKYFGDWSPLIPVRDSKWQIRMCWPYSSKGRGWKHPLQNGSLGDWPLQLIFLPILSVNKMQWETRRQRWPKAKKIQGKFRGSDFFFFSLERISFLPSGDYTVGWHWTGRKLGCDNKERPKKNHLEWQGLRKLALVLEVSSL
jgi:hypothetical protein